MELMMLSVSIFIGMFAAQCLTLFVVLNYFAGEQFMEKMMNNSMKVTLKTIEKMSLEESE